MSSATEQLTVYEIEAHEASYRIAAHPDSLVGRKLAGGVPYEHALLEHIYEQGFGDGVAIDVGAHIGNHSLWMAAVCGLSVEAFEPIHWGWLGDNLVLNPDLGVTMNPVALGATTGWAKDGGDRVLTALDESDEMRGRPTRNEGELKVGAGSIPVSTLDTFGFSDVAVIKMDVEGMETAVLLGAKETILRDRPVIFAEAQSHEAAASQGKILGPWGYRQNEDWNPNLVSTPVLRWDP